MTHDMLQPSDELLEQALARRAAHGADLELFDRIAAAAQSTPQARRWWPVGLPEMGGPALRLVSVVIVLMLMAAFALGAVVGGRLQNESSVVPAPIVSPSSTPDVYRASAWTATGNMVTPRAAHTATLLPDGTVLAAGGLAGSSDAALVSAELYDRVTGQWGAAGDMTVAGHGHTATLSPDGRVLVVGGISADSAARSLTSAELYDPISGTWTETDETTLERSGHTATLLPDGRVLVAGGAEWTEGGSLVPSRYNRLTSAELYDPVTETWTATGDMTQARDAHTATLLSDGRVLVAGGTRDVVKTGSAELYDAR